MYILLSRFIQQRHLEKGAIIAETNKIALITLSLKAGGTERAISELANSMVDLGMEVHVILLFREPHFFTLDDRVQLHEPEFTRQTVSKYRYFFKLLPFLRGTIRTLAPDAIVNFGYNSLVVALLTGMTGRLFISNRSNPRKKRNLFYKAARFITYSMAKGIIAQTSLAAEVYRSNTLNRNIRVIPNSLHRGENVPLGHVTRQKQLLFVGRLISTKGVADMLKAFQRINAPDWKLLIVGDGPKRAEYEQLARSLDISERACFRGFQQELSSLYSSASIFVFPSYTEGYPNALLEAMSYGLACISYDCDAGPRDLITHGKNGYLVPVGDVEKLAKQLEFLIDNPDIQRKLGNAAECVTDQHSREKIAGEILEFVTT